jgi:hypothetical protein
MPNICSNWIRVSNCTSTLEYLAARPLTLDIIDKKPESPNTPSSSDWAEEWVDKHWGTRWINGNTSEECDVTWTREDDGSLTARFFSAWSPPLAFYNRIVETYPQLHLEYEYAVWEMGCAGYGIGGSDPHHFGYDSKEEMGGLKTSRHWHVTIWNPHFSSPESE